ncbi:hypothetical protein CFT13S00388_07905 [Campylobacter fetus subsp. testudinum]|uniref:hypothetical protein n=1 Tax=Campylobacter fetus TaxID=196 RepID=UPI000818C98C|nr:hypothetical protein [Campylobacter fetus]OCR86674.1 hypothetical protein CFT13S00388_07905 [Campylobacter fetus subsp. testudinum]
MGIVFRMFQVLHNCFVVVLYLVLFLLSIVIFINAWNVRIVDIPVKENEIIKTGIGNFVVPSGAEKIKIDYRSKKHIFGRDDATYLIPEDIYFFHSEAYDVFEKELGREVGANLSFSTDRYNIGYFGLQTVNYGEHLDSQKVTNFIKNSLFNPDKEIFLKIFYPQYNFFDRCAMTLSQNKLTNLYTLSLVIAVSFILLLILEYIFFGRIWLLKFMRQNKGIK